MKKKIAHYYPLIAIPISLGLMFATPRAPLIMMVVGSIIGLALDRVRAS